MDFSQKKITFTCFVLPNGKSVVNAHAILWQCFGPIEANPRKLGKKNKKLGTPKHPRSVEWFVNRISK